MATGELPGLFAKIAVDDTEFKAGLASAQQELGNFRAHLNKGGVALAKFGTAAAVAGTAAAIAITKSAATAGKEIANLSRISGAGVVEFQKLAAGAQTVGIEQEKLGDIFKDTRDRIGDFIDAGGGPMADFFERIAPQVGVTAEQFRTLSGPQGLQLFVSTMEKAGLSANEMAFQMEQMASDSTALLPLLKENGALMRELGDNAEATGQILSEIDVGRLQVAAQDFEDFNRTIATLKNQLGAQLAPILAGVGKLLEDAATEAGGFGNLVGDAMNTGIEAVGFFADAIHGITTVFQAVSDGLIIGFTEIQAISAKAAGSMLAFADALPGVDMSEQLAQMAEFQVSVESVGKAAKEALHGRLMEPLPSESLKQWVGEVQASADEAARSVQERMAEATGGSGLQTFGSEEADKEAAKAAAKHKEELAARIERIRQANLTEQELMAEKYAMDALALQEARQAGLEIEGGFDEQMLALKANHEAAMTANEQKALEQRLALEKQAQQQRLQGIQGALSSVSTLMNSENRKMFEIGKAAAIAQSIINTYQGVSEAWKLGPILGPPLAALVATAGFANVANIRKQSFGSSGGPGAASATQQTNANMTGVGGAQGTGAQQQQTMFVSGINPNDLFTGEQLVNMVNTAQENGAVLRIAN